MSNTTFWNRLKEGLCQWIRLNLFLLVCMLVIRLFFYFQVHNRLEIDASQFAGIMKGSLFDGMLLARLIAGLSVPYLVLHCCFPKTMPKVYMGLVFLYVVIAALLTEYFCNLTMPLDHVVLVYTPEEVMGTASSSANITATPFLWFFGTLAVLIPLALLWRKVHTGWVFSLVTLLVSLAVAFSVPFKQLIREERLYKDHSSFCLAVNQPSYSFVKITDYIRESKKLLMDADASVSKEVLASAQRYQALHPEHCFLSMEYPFYRTADDPDVLGGFLEKTSDGLPPDFVFIIVEGLGQRLTGVNTPGISFTPFIDSLKAEGLYWKHCLSTAERTFGVLPALFASPPHGKYGFSVTNRPVPRHQSLLKDLKKNGYGISYYYGGVHQFDRYDGFLKANKVDYIYVPDIQQVDSVTYKYLNENHRWGLDDWETIQYVIEHKKAHPATRPNLDIVMTLTTHEPFFFREVDEYLARVESMLDEHPNLSERERNNIVKNPNVYACYLYMDDCVRRFIEFYQTLPEYQNTVFVLTGDHRMAPLNFSGPLNKYNVPLLVYSPLLHQSKAMDAVVSHLDVTPTLNAYLKANYDYQTDSKCHWLGASLDTTATYRNTRKQAFMLNNRDVVEYFSGDYYIANNRLYKVDDKLLQTQIEDEAVLQRMKKEMNDFKTVSCFAVQYDHLDPMSQNQRLLRSVETPNTVTIKPDREYLGLIEDLVVTEVFDDLVVDISLDLLSLDTLNKLPFIAVRFGEFYMGLRMYSAEEVSLNTGQPEQFHYHLNIPMEAAWKDECLKIYFYNKTKGHMQFSNLKINVSAVD